MLEVVKLVIWREKLSARPWYIMAAFENKPGLFGVIAG